MSICTLSSSPIESNSAIMVLSMTTFLTSNNTFNTFSDSLLSGSFAPIQTLIAHETRIDIALIAVIVLFSLTVIYADGRSHSDKRVNPFAAKQLESQRSPWLLFACFVTLGAMLVGGAKLSRLYQSLGSLDCKMEYIFENVQWGDERWDGTEQFASKCQLAYKMLTNLTGVSPSSILPALGNQLNSIQDTFTSLQANLTTQIKLTSQQTLLLGEFLPLESLLLSTGNSLSALFLRYQSYLSLQNALGRISAFNTNLTSINSSLPALFGQLQKQYTFLQSWLRIYEPLPFDPMLWEFISMASVGLCLVVSMLSIMRPHFPKCILLSYALAACCTVVLLYMLRCLSVNLECFCAGASALASKTPSFNKLITSSDYPKFVGIDFGIMSELEAGYAGITTSKREQIKLDHLINELEIAISTSPPPPQIDSLLLSLNKEAMKLNHQWEYSPSGCKVGESIGTVVNDGPLCLLLLSGGKWLTYSQFLSAYSQTSLNYTSISQLGIPLFSAINAYQGVIDQLTFTLQALKTQMIEADLLTNAFVQERMLSKPNPTAFELILKGNDLSSIRSQATNLKHELCQQDLSQVYLIQLCAYFALACLVAIIAMLWCRNASFAAGESLIAMELTLSRISIREKNSAEA